MDASGLGNSPSDQIATAGFPRDVSRMIWDNCSVLLVIRSFGKYTINSWMIASANTLLVSIFALLAAYAISRYKLTDKDSIFLWVLIKRTALMLPLFLMFATWFKSDNILTHSLPLDQSRAGID